MSEAIADTSVLQYLHQLDFLNVLPAVIGKVVVSSDVLTGLEAGRERGLDLPELAEYDWVEVAEPDRTVRLLAGLGAGETAVLSLALERPGTPVLLDDALARRGARQHGIPMTGTLGLLLDAKRAGLIAALEPVLDQLAERGFRMGEALRAHVSQQAGEG